MIAEENKVSTELVAHLKTMVYSSIIHDFIDFSSEEVIDKINTIIEQEMESIRYAMLSEHANVTQLREKHKIYETLRKQL